MTGAGTPVSVQVSWEQVLAWRMQQQYLVGRAGPDEVVAVVDRMCGLHAQVMSSVELALVARVDGIDRDAVSTALWSERTLVKLWAMRATLHVLPAAGLARWLAGLRTYEEGWPLYGLRDPAMLEVAELVGGALHGSVLTRDELADAVAASGGSTIDRQQLLGGWGSYLKPASFLGRLCFAPSQGRHVRFTHPSTWLPVAPEPMNSNTALPSIAERYLRTYGPGTAGDLAGWWGVNRATATRMLRALGDTVSEIRVDGHTLLMMADQVAELAATTTTPVVRLLPAFDQWIICANRLDRGGSRPGPGAPALDPTYRTRVYRRQGWVSPVLLVDGRVEGVWKHQRRGRRLHVEIEPFSKLSRRTNLRIEAEAERLATYLGGTLQLTSRP